MTVHNYTVEIDNWIDEEAPTTNHGSDTALWTRWDSTGKSPAGYDRKTVMRFQNTGASGHCQDAWLEVHVLETWGSPSGMTILLRIMRYYPSQNDDTDWQEDFSMWDYKGYFGGAGGEWRAWYSPVGGSTPSGAHDCPTSIGAHIFRLDNVDGKKLLKKLVDAYRDNNSGDTHLWIGNEYTGETDYGFTIAARDHATVAYRPVLVICEAGTNRRRHC